MFERLTTVTKVTQPRIWALLGARAGDNDQVIALAEALGLPFEIKQLQYNRLRGLGPRLLGSSLVSLTQGSLSVIVKETPPELTISTGHRSVPVVRALRRLSGGRTRSIHIGFPRVSPSHFDLVVTTPQYPIADHPNLLRIPFALTRAATEHSDGNGPLAIATLPEPRRLLIVGGPTLYWDLDVWSLLRTLRKMLDEALNEGGSVLVTTSPRTPAILTDQLDEQLRSTNVETLLAEPGRQPDYASLLSAANSIRVTADSVSMISDAIWTTKPLALVPISLSRSGRLAFKLNDFFRPDGHVYPQDLRLFWRALEKIGISEELAVPSAKPAEVMSSVRSRAQAIFARDLVY